MITKFKDIFEYYETYTNDDYLMNKVTSNLLRQVSNIFIQGLRNKALSYTGRGRMNLDGSMKVLCNIVCGYTNIEETKNWGWDFIIEDYKEAFQCFLSKPFHKFMDATSKIAIEFLGVEIVEELNEAFSEYNFGYRIQNDADLPWICINPNVNMTIEINEVVETTEELCKQTAEHIKQAKEQLSRPTNERARKDAIRDCLSAMEALVKKVTLTKDINGAIENMRLNGDIWGPKVITNDGIKLWNIFHTNYTDIRHGNDDISDITLDQCVYFVDRILAYVNYVSKVARENS